MNATEKVEHLRKKAAEYVQTQAHHMPDSWREWFLREFRLKAVTPYGVVLDDPAPEEDVWPASE